MNKDNLQHNNLEKAVFGFGAVVIVLLLSYLVFEAFKGDKLPPRLVISSEYLPKEEYHTYKIKIENKGEETAEAANVQLKLYEGGKVVRSGTLSVDFVPPKSTEVGWISFRGRRTKADSLVVSSVSFFKP